MDIIASLPLLQIHITAVFITLVIVAVADLHGLLWLMGTVRLLPARRMVILHRATWTGLLVIMFAGIAMFSFSPEYLLTLWSFRFKLVFITGLFINAFFIGKHIHLASERPFAELTGPEKGELLLSASVSSVGWIGAFVCAQFLS